MQSQNIGLSVAFQCKFTICIYSDFINLTCKDFLSDTLCCCTQSSSYITII